MSKTELIERAENCRNFDEVDVFLKSIEEKYDEVSDSLFYSLKRIALNNAYNYMCGNN